VPDHPVRDDRSPHLALALVVAAVAIGACLVLESPSARIALLATTLLVLASLELHRSRDLLSPMVLVPALFAWLYVAKPLHVLDRGTFSSGTAVDAMPVVGVWEQALGDALLAVVVTVCLVFVAFQAVAAHRPAIRRERPRPRPRTLDPHRFRAAATGAVVLDLLAFGILVRSAGGLGAYVAGLATRSESLAGLSFLTLATVPLNLVLLLGLTARFRADPGAPGRGLLALLLLLALVSAVLTGGRASLLTGLVLPLLVVLHHARRRISPLAAALLATGGLVVFVVLGTVLRDAQFARTSGRGAGSHVSSRLSNLHESLVGGVEAVPFDSLVRLLGAARTGHLDQQGGATYQSILTWPVPRMLWAEKPAGGGNAWFTETYVPRFYGDAKVESSVSFIGESFANFGWTGIVAGSLLLGALVGLLHARLGDSADVLRLPLYAALLGLLLPAFRGDAYHNVTSGLFVVAVCTALRLVVVARPRPAAVTPRRTALAFRRPRPERPRPAAPSAGLGTAA
jgi:hypothetical protein